MKNLRSLQVLRARVLRPVAPRCRNGVSSLLRLSQPEPGRLPGARAAGLLGGPEFIVGPLASAR